MWLTAGVVAAIIARQIPYGRPTGRVAEAAVSVAAAFAAGLAATVLDFGGWREPDWRAALFALVCAFAVTGIIRVIRMVL
jgi:hypothetical protein